tara:strand:+ start:405 stop:677 length:273 start_codon:yes stop_codon:yes gene_type:complete
MIKEVIFLIVVTFSGTNSDGTKNLYVFAQPYYEQLEVCQADITDPAVYPGLVQNLYKDYKGKTPGSIEKVQCVSADEVIEAVKRSQGTNI